MDDGFSISYGSGVGYDRQYGGGDGLRVLLLPFEHRAEVWLGGLPYTDATIGSSSLIWGAKLGLVVQVTRSTPSSAGEDSAVVGAAAAELSVNFNAIELIRVTIPEWGTLVTSGWRVGVGGGTADMSHFGEMVTAPHVVTDLTLQMGAAFASSQVSMVKARSRCRLGPGLGLGLGVRPSRWMPP